MDKQIHFIEKDKLDFTKKIPTLNGVNWDISGDTSVGVFFFDFSAVNDVGWPSSPFALTEFFSSDSFRPKMINSLLPHGHKSNTLYRSINWAASLASPVRS